MKFSKKNWGNTKPSVGYGVNWSDSISKGLVGCWLFNEGAGAFAYDIARKNKGTLTNMAFPATATSGWGVGKFGKALNFDGTDDYVNNTISGYRSSDSLGTISVWFKSNSSTNVLALVGSGDTAGTANYIFFGINGNSLAGNVYVQTSDGVNLDQVRTTANTFNDNVWHHAVLVSSGTAWSIYVDGVNQALTVFGGSNSGDWFADAVGRDNLTIGNLIRSTAIAHFSGMIDDVRIYNRALSAGEVKRLYSEPFAGILSPVKRMVNTIAAAGSIIKTVNGLAQASVKTFNGLASASVKTKNGLSNV